ncbi:MAG: hypothetical protein CV045_12650 [Cyanobacteria bacterium M5B4]|nr:MAG: hypothetical protein CV045_12650 [Cyanobacteria bacterium M5B4]
MSKLEQAGLSPRERWYALIGVMVAIGLIGLVWVLTDRTELPSVGEVSRPTPDVVLATLDGSEINVSQQQGRVVLVNFWGRGVIHVSAKHRLCRKPMPATAMKAC